MARFIPARAGNAAGINRHLDRETVHPRACGERIGIIIVIIVIIGSSPRVRGTHGARHADRYVGRFIPARAGNASGIRFCCATRTVHPRACGERAMRASGTFNRRFIPARAGNAPASPHWQGRLTVHPRACGERFSTLQIDGYIFGSSPRVRGTHDESARRAFWIRFIPARAGNASPLAPSVMISPVHPRACGERRSALASVPALSGSSPRVRGTLKRREATDMVHRFIPARAGNALPHAWRTVAHTVHPRACGERCRLRPHAPIFGGSSPRVRGTRRGHDRPDAELRFIPARAGNADDRGRIAVDLEVHPRACGERICRGLRDMGIGGSSPRVRGTRAKSERDACYIRFIPARAGNARYAATPAHRPAVHPRACGERGASSFWIASGSGSSPRVRGTHHPGLPQPDQWRFIPARAGNARFVG